MIRPVTAAVARQNRSKNETVQGRQAPGENGTVGFATGTSNERIRGVPSASVLRLALQPSETQCRQLKSATRCVIQQGGAQFTRRHISPSFSDIRRRRRVAHANSRTYLICFLSMRAGSAPRAPEHAAGRPRRLEPKPV